MNKDEHFICLQVMLGIQAVLNNYFLMNNQTELYEFYQIMNSVTARSYYFSHSTKNFENQTNDILENVALYLLGLQLIQ